MFVSSLGSGSDSPSFFELWSSRYLLPSLKRALQHVVQILATRYPALFRVLDRWDTVFALGQLLLESYFIHHHDASFSERVYGLKRVSTLGERRSDRYFQFSALKRALLKGNLVQALLSLGPARRSNKELNVWQKLSSAFFVVMWPILLDRLASYCQKLQQQQQQQNQDSLAWWQRLFVKLFPAAHLLYNVSSVLYQLFYSYQQTRYWSPELQLQGITIVRTGINEAQQEAKTARLQLQYALLQIQSRVPPVVFPPIRTVLLLWNWFKPQLINLIPFTAFLYSFLEQYYHGGTSRKMTLPVPPPPDVNLSARGVTTSGNQAEESSSRTATTEKPVPLLLVALPQQRLLCPLCKKPRTNPAVTCTGYVFCYPCIFKFVQEHGYCPISAFPLQADTIRKLYDSTD